MKTFHCDACCNFVFFENVHCVKCGHALGFLPDVLDLSALESSSDGPWRALSDSARDRRYRACRNGSEHQVCNWLVPADDPEPFCVSCRLNQVIPNLSAPQSREHWFKLEQAKRRLVYTLLDLALPMDAQESGGRPALRFNFLAEDSGGSTILTGHSHGVITINIAEADDAERERRRIALHEPYRTVLGHFRHEVGHYYWSRLVANTPELKRFRELFGDERRDYREALRNNYESGPPADWQARHVSAYASAHPWEDWAETWAHYLHIVDAVESAMSFGMAIQPKHPDSEWISAEPGKVTRANGSFNALLAYWFPLTYALNSLNRGMGLPDIYPFVLSNPAIEKLRYVDSIVRSARTGMR